MLDKGTKWFLSGFPESLYPTIAENRNEYAQRVIIGARLMAESTVYMVGLARNVGNILPSTVARIERLGDMFSDYRVVVFENDSTDNTVQLLNRWANDNKKVEVISEQLFFGFSQDKSLERRQRLAYCRNRYMDAIENKSPARYLMVLDMDLLGGFSYEGIANSFSYNFDMIASNGLIYKNGRRLMYDSWAYEGIKELTEAQKNLMVLNRGEQPIRVKSAFGGLCIYNYLDVVGLRYDSSHCDHVTFNSKLADRGMDKMYINPSMITLYSASPYYIESVQ